MQDACATADVVDGTLRLYNDAGTPHSLHPLWLRERCPCAECRDPGTGQRLLDSWSLPIDTAIQTVEADGDRLAVTFSDGHVAPFSLDGLRGAVVRPADARCDLKLWDADLTPVWRR